MKSAPEALVRQHKVIDAPGCQLKSSITFGVFLLLLLLLGTLLLSGIVKDLRIVEQERRGLELITKLRPLLENIPLHRGYCAAYQQGDSSFRAPCLEAAQKVDHSFAQFSQVDDVDLQRRVEAINGRWLRIKEQSLSLPPEHLFSMHSHLMSSVIDLGRHVAESANLIYDASADTYSLMDVVVFRLPMLAEAIGQLRGIGSAAATTGWVDEQIAIELAILDDQIKRRNMQLVHALEDVAEYNPQRASRLEPSANKLVRLIEEFRGLASKKQLDVSATQLFDVGSDAVGATFQFYEIAISLLDEVLLDRKKRIKRDLILSAAALVLVLLLAAFLFARLSLSLRQVAVSESRLSSVFKTVADGLVVIDEGGLIKSFNPSAGQIFGCAAGEIIGQNINVLVPEFRRDYKVGESRAISEGRHKDGRTFPIELTISTAEVGGERLSTAMIRDITRRKQVEKELVRQRHLIETISRAQSRFIAGVEPLSFFEGMLPDVLDLVDSKFGFIAEKRKNGDGHPYLKLYAQTNITWDDASRAMYEENLADGLEFHNLNTLFGHVIRSGEAVISNDPENDPRSTGVPGGHPLLDSFLGIPIYLGSRLLGMIGLANRPGGYDQSVIELLQPVLGTCAQIFDAIGKEQEQRRTALEVKRSNSFMNALVENLQAGLLVEDEAGKIHMVNQIYCDMFDKDDMPLMIEGSDGAPEFENIQSLFSDPRSFLRLRQACLNGLGVVTGQELLLNDGRAFEQGYVPIIFEDEQGLVHRSHLWSYHDISEHKRIQKTLGEAKEAAEAAARAKSQFLATMSHEIRTPMNGVLGMLHLLGKTELDASQRRFVTTAAGSGEMLLEVINDILDFSKLEADKLELESIPFDLIRLLEESVSLLASGAQQKGLELLCSLGPGLPRRVKGDPVRLRQVLTNLIANAIKFTEQGEIEIYASKGEAGLIHIGVKDTGIGMSTAQQQRLFKAFSQVDSSHTRKYGGTGLGLAICQKLITAMGGKIGVSSAQGEGADFSFELFFQVVDGGEHRGLFSNTLAEQRILVVEDNDTSRLLLQKVLACWQVDQVGLAEGGADALEQLRAAAMAGAPYDIAILDLLMPGMDGVVLAKKIRADASLKEMKLMMFSALDQDKPMPELDAWLTKPMRQSELFNTLLQLIGEQVKEGGDAASHEEEREWWFGGNRLLLVEDNHVNQEVAKEILGASGFDIDIRDNGKKAVQAVEENSYDVVLMDIQMPIMDGLQAVRNIRRLGGRFAELPVIAMTAHALSGDAEKSLAAGMNAHVTKPIDPEALFMELSRWVNAREKPAAAREAHTATEGMPEGLPGIELADGLQRLNGNWAAYKRILLGFRDKQADAAQRLERLVLQGEWEEAARLAHTLKGSGGNLGAKQLYESAAAMEQACRNRDADAAKEGMKTLCACLAQVVDGVAILAEQGQAAAVVSSAAFDPITVRQLLDELLACLDTDLGAAQDRFVELQQLLLGSEHSTTLTALENALNSFDIGAAKAIIQELQIV